KEGVTWTKVTTSAPGFRLLPKEANYDVGGSSILFDDIEQVHRCMGFLNTPLATYLIRLLNTSVNIQVGDIEDLPDLSSKVNPKDVSRAIE
ncbi:BREX-1 system adenine-specific DNA-methyltransferase PglX, partial [Klebsiella pneumoniae]|nr:BREX-1 system adenine-specific DNA-methyltransferase PglX [Klebsiella pneumoniae]